MTAEVFSVDGARVSARGRVPSLAEIDPGMFEIACGRTYEYLKRQIDREADKTFGSAPRRTIVYLTVEEVVDVPESDAAA